MGGAEARRRRWKAACRPQGPGGPGSGLPLPFGAETPLPLDRYRYRRWGGWWLRRAVSWIGSGELSGPRWIGSGELG